MHTLGIVVLELTRCEGKVMRELLSAPPPRRLGDLFFQGMCVRSVSQLEGEMIMTGESSQLLNLLSVCLPAHP